MGVAVSLKYGRYRYPVTKVRAHKMTVATVIAGQVMHIRTTVEQPAGFCACSVKFEFSRGRVTLNTVKTSHRHPAPVPS